MSGIQNMLVGGKVAGVAPQGFNPLDKGSNITLSNSNFTASKSASGFSSVRSVTSNNTGLKYFEVTVGGSTGVDLFVGVAAITFDISVYLGNAASGSGSDGYWGNATSGNLFLNINATSGVTIAGYTVGDIIGVGVDFGSKTVKFYKNGTLLSTHNVTGTMPTLYAGVSVQNTGSGTINTGPTFSALPVGYSAWG